MNQLLEIITNNPLISIVCGILFIVFVISLIKAAFKIAIVFGVLLICAMVVFDVDSPKELLDKGTQKITTEIQEEIKSAKYEAKEDGSFAITTDNLSLTKKANEEKVTVSYKDKTFQVNYEAVKEYITDEEFKARIESFMEQSSDAIKEKQEP